MARRLPRKVKSFPATSPRALTAPWPWISAAILLPSWVTTSQPLRDGPWRVCQTRSQVPAMLAGGSAAACAAKAKARKAIGPEIIAPDYRSNRSAASPGRGGGPGGDEELEPAHPLAIE